MSNESSTKSEGAKEGANATKRKNSRERSSLVRLPGWWRDFHIKTLRVGLRVLRRKADEERRPPRNMGTENAHQYSRLQYSC